MSSEQLKLDNQVCFPLYSASRMITKAYKPYLEQLEITYPQYLTLLVLWEHDGITVNDISKKLLLNTNTLSPLLQRMDKQDLIERKRSDSDERSVLIWLTAKGKSMKKEAAHIPSNMLNKLTTADVELNDILQLKVLLNQWIDILKDKK